MSAQNRKGKAKKQSTKVRQKEGKNACKDQWRLKPPWLKHCTENGFPKPLWVTQI
jgi:hypothetical protein